MTTFDHEDEPQARWASPIEGSAASHWPDLPIATPGGAPEHRTATKTPTTPSRRGRAGVIVTGLLIAMLASTVALGALSVRASVAARHDRQAAHRATRTRADLAARGHAAGVERNTIAAATSNARRAFEVALDRASTTNDDDNHLTDLQGQALDLLAQGNVAAAEALWNKQLDPAIGDLQVAASAAHAALDDADAAARKLKDTTRG